MVKHRRPISLVHSLQQATQLINTGRHLIQDSNNTLSVIKSRGGDSIQDQWNHFCAACFHRDGYNQKPALIVCGGEGVDEDKVIRVCEVYLAFSRRSEIPEV